MPASDTDHLLGSDAPADSDDERLPPGFREFMETVMACINGSYIRTPSRARAHNSMDRNDNSRITLCLFCMHLFLFFLLKIR